MKIIVLGDVHGNILRCQDVALRNPQATIIQIGDFGVGFMPREVIERLPDNFTFFVGNHDNRQLAYSFRSCLGDFGHVCIQRINGAFTEQVFFVSGADSKDKANRTPGLNWWPDEELTYALCQECLDLWAKSKATVLLSHDLPQRIAENYYLIYDRSRTRQLLDRMIEVRKPKLVVFGHHHKPFHVVHEGVEYFGLKIDETISLDISEKSVKVTV